jgi:hypothetical protein
MGEHGSSAHANFGPTCSGLIVRMTAMAGPVELMQQIADIALRQKTLQDKLRSITKRLAAGAIDTALGQENNRLQKEIANLEERKARLLRG